MHSQLLDGGLHLVRHLPMSTSDPPAPGYVRASTRRVAERGQHLVPHLSRSPSEPPAPTARAG